MQHPFKTNAFPGGSFLHSKQMERLGVEANPNTVQALGNTYLTNNVFSSLFVVLTSNFWGHSPFANFANIQTPMVGVFSLFSIPYKHIETKWFKNEPTFIIHSQSFYLCVMGSVLNKN